MQSNQTMTRRAALRRLAGSCATAAFVPAPPTPARPATAADLPAKTPGAVIAREANGTEIHQVTTERLRQSNIYCEIALLFRRFPLLCLPADRSRVGRQPYRVHGGRIGHLETAPARRGGLGRRLRHVARRNLLLSEGVGHERPIMRADLAAGTPQEVFRRPGGPAMFTASAPSPATAATTRAEWRLTGGNRRLFGIALIDLRKGTETVIDRDPRIFNPHPQFDPGRGKWLMIQHDRNRTVGPNGKTPDHQCRRRHALSAFRPRRQARRCKSANPYTTSVTGHEAWIGATGEMLLSVVASGNFTDKRGSLLAIRPGGAHRVVAGHYSTITWAFPAAAGSIRPTIIGTISTS